MGSTEESTLASDPIEFKIYVDHAMVGIKYDKELVHSIISLVFSVNTLMIQFTLFITKRKPTWTKSLSLFSPLQFPGGLKNPLHTQV